MLAFMDSLLDQALLDARDGLLDLPETATRRALEARLGILERAMWTVPLEPARADQVLRLARAVLDLRDEVTAVSSVAGTDHGASGLDRS